MYYVGYTSVISGGEDKTIYDYIKYMYGSVDKVRLNGVAKINARGSLDFDILGAVCNKIHKKASFVQNLGSVNRTDGIVPQNPQNATVNCKNSGKKKARRPRRVLDAADGVE